MNAKTPLNIALQGILSGGLTLIAVSPSLAQQVEEAGAERLETITVVGSRIKRTDIETSQPVFVLERQDLQRTGLTSIGDILQDLTSNGETLNTTFNNGGDGTTAVDLRDLGPDRTLVLVNGRRWVRNLGGYVDLTTIPVSVVERVEILKDGASSIYGSDAIAGVINITTRDNYDGAEASAYIGENEEGDGRTEAYDFTIGSSTDRASAVLNVSYAKQESILAADRQISAVPTFGFGGNNVNVGASSTSPFGRFGRPGVPGTVTLIPGRPGTAPGDFRAFSPATDGFNFAPDNYLSTPQERTAVFTQVRYQLTENTRFTSSILFNERRSNTLLAVVPFTFGPIFGNDVTVSASNVYNPFGVEVTRAQYRNTLAGRESLYDSDTFYFSGGFDGVFDLFERSFSWDVSYIYTDNEERVIETGQFDLNRLRTGLGPSFRDAAGVARCGTASAPIAGCVPINLFGGPTGFTREMQNYAGVVLQNNTYTKLYDYTANVTGDLFELPAGPLGFAAGYEYRRESGFNLPDALTASGATTGSAAQPTRGGFALDEFYAEFSIPLLKDSAFAEIFEISLATRYSDYTNFGDTTNPKFGFRWKPYADLLIRGNYAKGFRAPTITDLFLGNSDSFPELEDPCSASFIDRDPAVRNACRSGIGGIAGTPVGYEQANSQIRITVGGNPALGPEEARNKTLGLVYSPSFVEGLDLYLDWYNIQITNSIGALDPQLVLNQCYDGSTPSYCALITRTQTGDIVNLVANTTNSSSGGTEIEGYDFTVSYRFDTEFGKFRINWDNAYVSYFGDIGQPEAGDVLSGGTTSPGNTVGVYINRTNFSYRLKSNVSLNWQSGDWGATLSARYLSAIDESCSKAVAFGRPELCSNPGGSPQFPNGENRFDDTWYFDLQASWDAPWDGRITAGVRNLFDQDPPVSFSTFANSFDPNYDVPGRFLYMQYSQKF
jgi:iron complex outermembrane receptor protein